jgi:hypothetical protein
MCELTHGMARERHGHGMLCVNPAIVALLLVKPEINLSLCLIKHCARLPVGPVAQSV